MREKEITQDELAKKIGISGTSLNLKLSGKREFKGNEMFAIAETLGVSDKIDVYFFANKL